MSGNEASARGMVYQRTVSRYHLAAISGRNTCAGGVMIASRRPFIVGMSARTDQCKFHQEWRDDHEGSDVI